MTRLGDTIAAIGALVAIAVLSGPARAQSTGQNPEKITAIDSLLHGATVALHVDGMSCPFCAYGLEKRLMDIAAIDTVVIRVSDGLVLIRPKSGEQILDEELHGAVERAGFSLREIRRVEHLEDRP